MTDCVCRLSPFVRSEEGAKLQRKLWQEMMSRFEKIWPGITKNV